MQAFEKMKEFMEKQCDRDNRVCDAVLDHAVTHPSNNGFSIGQTVAYRIPIIETQTKYSWEWHRGTITDINAHAEQITVKPDTEAEPWRVVSWCYCEPPVREKEVG